MNLSTTPKLNAVVFKRALPLAVTTCLSNRSLKHYTVSDKDYQTYASPYNQYIKTSPDVVVLARDSTDVQRAVICAAQSKMRVQARAGGHSYAAFSSGTKNGGMVIDLRNLASIKIDKKGGFATVGGGTRLGK